MAGKKLVFNRSTKKIGISILSSLNILISVAFMYLYYFVGFAQQVYFTDDDPAEKARYLHDTTVWVILSVVTIAYLLINLIATIIWLKNDSRGRPVLFAIALLHPIIEFVFGLNSGMGVDIFCLSFVLVTIILDIPLILLLKNGGSRRKLENQEEFMRDF